MTYESEFDSRRDEAKRVIAALLQTDPIDIAKRADLGALNFEESVPLLNKYFYLLRMISDYDFNLVPNQKLDVLISKLKGLGKLINRLKDFKISEENPSQKRADLITQINGDYDIFVNAILPLIPFLLTEKKDYSAVDENVKALETSLIEKMSRVDKANQDILIQQQTAANKAKEILESLQKAAADVGVSQKATFFAAEAKQYDESSSLWRWGTIIMTVSLIAWGYAVLEYFSLSPDAKTPTVVQFALGKIIIVSGIYYGLIWCARNYTANRHNYVVNKHRQNSLSTFETFVSAAGPDSDIKNAVLLQATTSIFSYQPSGYGHKDSDQEQPTKILEILRSTAKPPSSGS